MVISIHIRDLNGDMLNRNKEFINKIRELNYPSTPLVYKNDVQRIDSVSESSLIGGQSYWNRGCLFHINGLYAWLWYGKYL